jgi:hypothetical protein
MEIVEELITVSRFLNYLPHSKRPVGGYVGFTQIVARGGKRYVISGK